MILNFNFLEDAFLHFEVHLFMPRYFLSDIIFKNVTIIGKIWEQCVLTITSTGTYRILVGVLGNLVSEFLIGKKRFH